MRVHFPGCGKLLVLLFPIIVMVTIVVRIVIAAPDVHAVDHHP